MLLPEEDRQLPTEGFDEHLEANVRRAVVEHCLYGVDLDPLAVELARVALWIETLDKRLPFTFLDHKLRCGDALVGAWLDRFREYPLLCFDRASPDYNYTGVNRKSDVWHKAFKARRAAAIDEQVDLLAGQLRMKTSAASDEELKAAVERVRRLYRDLRSVPTGRPDERASIWRGRIQCDAALARVREAFDTWCALWFWPFERLDEMPMPSELHSPSTEACAIVNALRNEKRFFHWELEYPDVFTGEGAGFDAVVGNPPWETLQPQSKEFFSNLDPLYRSYSKQAALRIQRTLFETSPKLELEWLEYNGGFKAISNWVKHVGAPFGDAKVAEHGGGDVSLARGKKGVALHKAWRVRRSRYRGMSDPAHPFRHQGEGKPYTHKMFVELGYSLLRAGGQLGLIVPSSLCSDKGTGELRRLLLEQGKWRWLFGFENRNKLFDIHRSFKFCVAIAEKGGQTEAMRAAFMQCDLEDWSDAAEALEYPAEHILAFSPRSRSILEIRSDMDLMLLTKLYAHGIPLGHEGNDGWGVRYAQGDFNMTSDSKLFTLREVAEEQGFQRDQADRWVNNEGEILLPLYEGRMIGQFDFSAKGWVSGKGRGAVWRDIPWTDKQVEPQFVLARKKLREVWTKAWLVSQEGLSNREAKKASVRLAEDPGIWRALFHTLRTRVAFMDVTASTNRRTMVATYLFDVPCGHSASILTGASTVDSCNLVAALNSFAYDWNVRARCGGLHLSWYVIEESAVPTPQSMRVCGNLAMRLQTSFPSAVFALKNEDVKPFRHALSPHERLRIRCMLDAIVAVLYGLDRSDFAWILRDCDHPVASLSDKALCRQLDPKGFWRVDKSLEPELRHSVLSFVAFNDLQSVIATTGNDPDEGIRAFCAQNGGDGWMLPETLCLANLGLVRTVNVGEYDDRARRPQPVRSRLGERFLDWQLTQTPEESWRECERHAKTILESMPEPSTTKAEEKSPRSEGPVQGYLPGMDD